jgi:hypothetical protein
MMTRIREQLGSLPDLKASGEVEVSASAVTLPDLAAEASLHEQVQNVAERVTEMARLILTAKNKPPQKKARKTSS